MVLLAKSFFLKKKQPPPYNFWSGLIGKYHPAISCFQGASVTVNFGPTFQFEPPAGTKPYSEVAQVIKWTNFGVYADGTVEPPSSDIILENETKRLAKKEVLANRRKVLIQEKKDLKKKKGTSSSSSSNLVEDVDLEVEIK
jgi:hypothetical protein